MNPEPTYSYVRGQGWVVLGGQVIKMQCGTAVILENRQPKVGEVFFIGYGFHDPNRDVKNIMHVEMFRYNQFNPLVDNDVRDYGNCCMVLVPV